MAAPIAIPGSSGALSAGDKTKGGCKYLGISVRETAGATAVIRIRDNLVGGTILDTISLLANESVREWYGPQGKVSNGDLFYEKVSGTVEGAVFYG